MFPFTLGRWLGKPSRSSTEPERPSFRPRVESLEAREVPAFLTATDLGSRVSDAVVVADFNGDSKPDLASVAKVKNNYAAGTISVQLGDGHGGFGNSKNTTLSRYPEDMAAADFNGDGKMDLVTTGGGNVTVLLGKGTGMFQAPKNFALTNASGYSLAVADFDGNGKLDVAVTGLRIAPGGGTMNGVVDVFKGDGKGSLALAQSYNLPTTWTYDWMGTVQSPNRTLTAVGDFNGDHRPDLAVAVPFYPTGNGSIFMLTNAGGSLTAPSEIGLSAGATLAVGDMNGDHRADLVTKAGVSLGNGDGTFQTPVLSELDLTHWEDAITLADFNGDGRLDVATNTRYFLGNGDGTVQASVDYASWMSNGAFGGVAAGDFNGDGFLDLMSVAGDLGSYRLRVALNDRVWA